MPGLAFTPRLDFGVAGEIDGSRIVDGDTLEAVGTGAEQQTAEADLEGLVGHGGGAAELVEDLAIGARDAGATEDVVEMVEDDLAPGVVEIGKIPLLRGTEAAPQAPRLVQKMFGATHGSFDGAMDAITADGVHLELAGDEGKFGDVAANGLEITRRSGEEERMAGKITPVLAEPGDLFFGGAAAVIADADEAHGVLNAWG